MQMFTRGPHRDNLGMRRRIIIRDDRIRARR
jgi:hypothetical protein